MDIGGGPFSCWPLPRSSGFRVCARHGVVPPSPPARSAEGQSPPGSTAGSTTPSGRRSRRTPPSRSRTRGWGSRRPSAPRSRLLFGPTASTSASSASTPILRASSCRRPSATPRLRRRRRSSRSSTRSTTTRTRSCSAPTRSASSTDGQVAREGQTSGQTLQRRRRRRRPAWRHQRLQPELGRRLDGARADHRARLGGRDGHPAEDASLRPGREQDLGLQRDAQHPSQERAGLPVVHPARLRHLPHFAGGQGAGPEHAETPRHQADSLCAGLGQQGLHARQRPAGPRLPGRDRHEVGRHAEPDARRHRQHRLRASGGRRGAGQPDPLRPVLPREAAVLPGERVHLPVRPAAVGSTCSSRGASACPARRARCCRSDHRRRRG